jgi:cell division protein FtsQ
VTGTSHLTRQEVVRLSGLTTRANALWLGTTPIERRLETDPWVAHATVSRSLPWTVRIQITERRPIAVTVQEGGYELIAGDGTSLGDVAANPGLPEIVMPVSWGEYAPSDVSGPAEAIAGLDPRIRSKVQWAVVAPDSTIDLFLGNGLRVRYGEPTQIPAKSRALLHVLRWARMQGESLVAVDVLAPDAPAATLAG